MHKKEESRSGTAWKQLTHCCMKEADLTAQGVTEHRKPYLEKKMVF
jgi:hypothetical protein